MFSFFNKSNAPSTSTTPTREPTPATMHPSDGSQGYQGETTSSFSFISGPSTTASTESGLFGGMNVSEDPNAAYNPSQDAGSSFSFMNSSASQEEAAPNSGFSFMSSSESAPSNSEPSSGFSFMSSGNADVPPPVVHSAPAPDLMSMSEAPVAAQDLKLNKVAAQKVVKKKKKSARVGVDREDADDRRGSLEPDNEELANYQQEQYAQQQHYQQEVAAHHEPEYAHDVHMDQPPPPVPVTPPPLPVQEYVEEEPQHHHYEHEVPVAPPAPAVTNANDLLMSLGSTTYGGVLDVPLTSTYVMETAAAQPVVESTPPPVPVVAAVVEEEAVEESKDDVIISTTFTKNIHQLDANLCNVLLQLQSSYQTAQATQQFLLRQTEETHNAISSLKDKMILLEMKQSNFAKQEDFEQAELVSHDIDLLQQELQQKVNKKDQLLVQLQQQRAQYGIEKAAYVQSFVKMLEGMNTTCESTSIDLQQQEQRLQDYIHDEKNRIQIDQQRVDLEVNHCQREQDTLQQETNVIEEAIQVQVGDLYVKRTTLADQVQVVQDEIHQLELLLAAKRAEESELSKNLKAMDSKIQEVRKKYDRQLLRINDRKETLQRAQNECIAEQTSIDQHQQKINEIVTSSQVILQETQSLLTWKQSEQKVSSRIIEDLLATSTSTSTTTSTTTSAISSLGLEFSWYHVTNDALIGSIAGTSTEAVTELRQQVEATEALFAHSKAQIEEQSIEHELLVTKQKMTMENIERLEIAKKVHAANKRFKEAGATAKELKDACDAKEKLELDVQQSNEQMSALVQQSDQIESNSQQLLTQLRDVQRVEKLEHLNHIIGRIFTTKRILRQLQGEYNRLQENTPTERKGMISIAIDLYNEELNQLSSLRSKLATTCDVVNIEEYATQFEPVEEVEEVEEVAPVAANEEDLVPVSTTELEIVEDLVNNSEVVDMLEAESPIETPEQVAEDVPLEEVPVEEVHEEPVPEVPAEPQISAEELQEKISQLESDMEQAAGDEDYDKAASLCEEIEVLKNQLEKLQS